ncbi:MAG: type II TA system antitoxin MqsA family protein, partial [Bacilli bacterium]
MNIQLICDCCNELREFQICDKENITYVVKGDVFHFDGKTALCLTCGNEGSNMEVERYNQSLAFRLYREKHNLISIEEIQAIRKRYNLKQKDYSLLLGFGEIQITRYERGTLPSPAHSTLMKLSQQPLFMMETAKSNAHKVDRMVYERLLDALQVPHESEEEIMSPLVQMLEHAPDQFNGYNVYTLE